MSTIKQLRTNAELTQIELAEEAGVSYATISRAENGKPISKKSLLHLCRALGVRVEDVTGVEVIKVKR